MRGPGRGWSSCIRYCENATTRGLAYAMRSEIARYSAWRRRLTPAIRSGVLWMPNSVR